MAPWWGLAIQGEDYHKNRDRHRSVNHSPDRLGSRLVPDDRPDIIGVWYEIDGYYRNCIENVEPNTFVPMYVILSGVTRPYVAGWEVAFEFAADSGAIISTTYAGGGINFAEVPSFIVGLNEPLETPADQCLVLAEMNFLFLEGVSDWYGGPTVPATIPLVPAYVNAEDLTDVVPCQFPWVEPEYLDDNGWTILPIATVNGDCAIATETQSWSTIKSMYR